MSEKTKRSRQVSEAEQSQFIGWLAIIHGCDGENIQSTATRLGVAPGTVRSWLAGRSTPSLMAYRLIRATYDSVAPCEHCHGSGKVLPEQEEPVGARRAVPTLPTADDSSAVGRPIHGRPSGSPLQDEAEG